MINFPLTSSSKKLYTCPRGTFTGVWQGKLVWLKDSEGKIFHRIDVRTAHKGRARNVIVIVENVNAKIYEPT